MTKATLANAAVRTLGCFLVLLVVGVPIVELGDFILFAAAALCVLFGSIERASFGFAAIGKRGAGRASRTWITAGMSAGVAGSALIVVWLVPRPAIEEGQGVYVPLPGDDTYAQALPVAVDQYLLTAFTARFPERAECAASKRRCWLERRKRPPAGGFAFASQSLLRPAQMSRVVEHIDFDSRGTLPLVGLNDLRYNFHPPYSRSWVRQEIPYFVVYDLPRSLEGGTLCWHGRVFWESDAGQFVAIDHRQYECVALDRARLLNGASQVRRIIGVETLPEAPLAMRLELPPGLAATTLASDLVRWSAVVLIVMLLVDLRRWRPLLLPLGALAATVGWAQILEPLAYTGFRIHAGGSDGLGYESFARDMVQAAAAGDWYRALKGVEPIFWSMPGLRYYLAALKPIFADTFFAYLAAVVFLPIVIHRILACLTSARAAGILAGVFVLTPVLEYFRFTHYIYVKLIVDKGLAETLGYLLFLVALVLAIRPLARTAEISPKLAARYTYLGAALIGFTCFAAVAMRPNIGPSAALLLVVVGLVFLRHGYWARFAILCLGFAPIALLSIHNVVYGGEFHLLTMTGDHPDNLEMPPAVWVRALGQLVSGDFTGAAFQHMVRHLHTWNSPDEFYRVIAFFVVVWVAVWRNQAPALRLTAWLALSQQATLFFFHASGRYAFLAWLLTFIVFATVIVEQVWPWWRRRRARRRPARGGAPLSAAHEPASYD